MNRDDIPPRKGKLEFRSVREEETNNAVHKEVPMFLTKNSLNAVCVMVIVGAVAGWQVRLANASTTELCLCICNAVRDYLKPERITVNGNSYVRLNGSHDSGSTENPPASDKPPTDLQAFAVAIRKCVKDHATSGKITNQQCDCVIDNQTFSLVVSADVDGDSVTATGSADIVIAVAGNQSDSSTQDGEDATATNNSNGGAAVAVGGNGGGNNNNPGEGGKGSATSKGGDSSSAGGAGGDPADDEKAGGKGGAAKANQQGWPGIPGSGVGLAEDDGVDGILGYHGGGAWANAGRIAPGSGTAARHGHGGLRVNDASNTNLP